METLFQPARCPEQLNAAQIADWQRDGFLAFTDVLSPAETEAAKAALSQAVDDLRFNRREDVNGYGHVWRAREGKLAVQFEQTGAPIESDAPDLELKIRKFLDVIEAAPAVETIATAHPKIRAILDELIGQDAILTQNMALVKPPGGVAKPWHQDDAYFKIAPLNAVCGVWIALDDAGLDNGCMRVWPGGHHVGALRHYHGADCEIVPDRVLPPEVVAVPLPPGGAIFFGGLLPHQTPINASDSRRRALQFHYRARDSRVVSDEAYDQIFAEADGTPASCAAATARGF